MGLKDPVYLTVSRNLVLWVDNSNIWYWSRLARGHMNGDRFSSLANLCSSTKIEGVRSVRGQTASDIKDYVGYLLGKALPFVYKSPTAVLVSQKYSLFVVCS